MSLWTEADEFDFQQKLKQRNKDIKPNGYSPYIATKIEPTVVSYTTPQTELNDGGEPVKNATYWKRQYNQAQERIAELKYVLLLHTEPQLALDRIAELEKQLNLHKNAHHQAVEILREQKSAEPVAWGYSNGSGGIYDCISPEEHDKAEGDYTIPLYTTPQTKPLSDVEISHFKAKWYYREFDSFHELVRAIEERILGK